MMLLNPTYLSDQMLQSLDVLSKVALEHDKGLPAIYHHLLILEREPPSHFLYFETPNQLTAYLSVYFFRPHQAEISLLVHPDCRKRGLAKRQFEAAKPLLHTERIRSVLFSAPPISAPYLEQQGLTLCHSEYHLRHERAASQKLSSPKLSIRKATHQDISDLCIIDKCCFETEDDDMQERFEQLLGDERYCIWIAEYQNKRIGKVHLRDDSDETQLSDLAVLPEFQHRGFGAALLTHAIQHEDRPIGLEVETNQHAVLKLYTDHGFVEQYKLDFWEMFL